MRKSVVSRTIKSLKVSVTLIKLETKEIIETSYVLLGKFKSNEKCLKEIKAQVETDNVKVLSVNSVEEVINTYEMPIEHFIRDAIIVNKEVSDVQGNN